MCQESTELVWIGCWKGLILILKFKFDTLTPNTNSQTCWPKVISHVTNGTVFFICSTSGISAPLAAVRIPAWQAAPRWRKGCRSKKEKKKKELYPSRDQQRWIYLLLLRQVPPPHRVFLHLKVWRCRSLRGNPTAGWVLIQAHSTQRRLLKCD